MQYHLFIDNKQTGPFEKEQLLANGMCRETLVWADGMSSWTPAGEVAELAELFAAPAAGPAVPPLPAQEAGSWAVPPIPTAAGGKNKAIAALLAIFAGVFGLQYLYMGKKEAWRIVVSFSTVLLLLLLVNILVGIYVFEISPMGFSVFTLFSWILYVVYGLETLFFVVQGIILFTQSDREFDEKFVSGPCELPLL